MYITSPMKLKLRGTVSCSFGPIINGVTKLKHVFWYEVQNIFMESRHFLRIFCQISKPWVKEDSLVNGWRKIDSNGHMVKVWFIKKDEHTATCTLCHKDINVEHMGFGALKQHAKKQIHREFTSQFTKSRAAVTTESCRKETKEECTKSSAEETKSYWKETRNVEETKSQQKLMQDFCEEW